MLSGDSAPSILSWLASVSFCSPSPMLHVLIWGVVCAGAVSGLIVLFLVAIVVLIPRNTTWLKGHRRVMFERPMLFPTVMTHARVSPTRNVFRYRLLLIGIPVGFRGRVGNLLSVDEPLEHDEKGRNARMSWKTIFTTWFSFDPVRYLHRGDDNHSGLEFKLHQFLRSQVIFPSQSTMATVY